MNARSESRVLVRRLLPSTNRDPQDRASAWREWYTSGGAAAVLSFVRVKNDTPELDMDIFQEAMMTAYVEVERGRYQPRDGIPFAAYVKGIARNKIREARRRTRRFVPLDDAEHIDADIELPAETIERKERHTSLRTGLAKLTAGRRQVLESYLKGHTTAEIARALDMSEDSVRQHKCRGLRSLRRNLKEMDVLAPRC